MLELILLSTFVTVIGLIVYKEYQNTKRYNEERKKYREKDKPSTNRQIQTPLKETPTPSVEKPRKTPPPKEEITQKPVEIPVKEKEEAKTVDLPTCDFPPFDHSRTIAMGFSEDEVIEFMHELISQVETQIPLIEEQLQVPDFHKMERLTHSIKGSATNLGTGSVSDLLIQYNTYLKTGTDLQIATAYFECLKTYAKKLKEQYS